MTYKNWDKVRDNRLHVYLNQHELDTFLEAMRLRDLGQKSTAARTMLIEQAQAIIIDSRKHRPAQTKTQTVKYQLPSGFFTVLTKM